MKKYDPKLARDMFVVQGMKINEIARACGVSPSSISERSKREDWLGQKLAYDSAVARRSYESMAAGVAAEASEIAKENILAARATIRKYLADLAGGKVQVGPRDAELMMRFLIGVTEPQPGLNHGTETKNVTPPNADFMQEIIKRAREKVGPAPVISEGLKVH